jgi:hypothetical protein
MKQETTTFNNLRRRRATNPTVITTKSYFRNPDLYSPSFPVVFEIFSE